MTCVPRPYLAKTAVQKAEQKDLFKIDRLLTLLQNPYSDQPDMDAYAPPSSYPSSIYRSVAHLKASRSPGILYAPVKSSIPLGGVARLTVTVGS